MNMLPGLFLEAWHAWSAVPLGFTGGKHDILASSELNIPSMLRRRLDDTGRATCLILAALDPEATCPLIHASRHGDASHTLEMLESLVQGQPISPMRFSMSVHNAVLGIHSIANRHHRPLQALGACGNEFDALVYEACGYFAEGYSSVVVAFSEGPYPPAYRGHADYPISPCAVGMKLSLNEGRGLTCQPHRFSASPTPLDVIAWLDRDTPYLSSQWQWQLEEG